MFLNLAHSFTSIQTLGMKASIFYKYLLLLLCVCWLSVGNAQVYEKQLLDDRWKFHFGHAGNPEKDFNYGIANIFAKSGAAAKTAIDPKFNDSSWRTLNLPHDWAVELPFTKSSNFDVIQHGFKPVGGLFPETSVGWYRKQFTVNKDKKEDDSFIFLSLLIRIECLTQSNADERSMFVSDVGPLRSTLL